MLGMNHQNGSCIWCVVVFRIFQSWLIWWRSKLDHLCILDEVGEWWCTKFRIHLPMFANNRIFFFVFYFKQIVSFFISYFHDSVECKVIVVFTCSNFVQQMLIFRCIQFALFLQVDLNQVQDTTFNVGWPWVFFTIEEDIFDLGNKYTFYPCTMLTIRSVALYHASVVCMRLWAYQRHADLTLRMWRHRFRRGFHGLQHLLGR